MWNPEDLWRHENPIFWITKRIYTEEEKKKGVSDKFNSSNKSFESSNNFYKLGKNKYFFYYSYYYY